MFGCADFFIGDTRFPQVSIGNTAVWAVFCRKEHCARFVRYGRFRRCFPMNSICRFSVRENTALNDILTTSFVFFCFPGIPVLNRSVVTGDATVHFRFLSALRAGKMLAGKITVVFADGIRRRNRVIGKSIVLCDFLYEACCRLPVR